MPRSEIARRRPSGSWAIVLGGGEGSRLRAMAPIAAGRVVPKQFCSLLGGPSLLRYAMARAAAVTSRERLCAVVAARHHCWWRLELGSLASKNIFVQPEDKGSALGILLALLHLEAREPHGTVLILPADHYIRDSELFAQSLRLLMGCARADDGVYLLGAKPDRAATELCYLVPAYQRPGRPVPMLGFVEGQDMERVRYLLSVGALWHLYIVAGSVRAIIGLYGEAFPEAVSILRAAVREARRDGTDSAAISAAYRRLPRVDFSRDILEPQSAKLQVLRGPRSGWSDLGTPNRVGDTLFHLAAQFHPAAAQVCPWTYEPSIGWYGSIEPNPLAMH